MAKMTTVGKVVAGAIIAALIIILIIIYQSQPSKNQPGNSSTTNSAGNNAPASSGAAPANTGTSGATNTSPTPRLARSGISFVTPVKGDVWKIAVQNMISWTKAGGISGNIYLVDARTQKFQGVVLPQTGPAQTSYAWNTRDIFLDRTSPLKKDVAPGTYVLKIAFDGNNLPIVTSPTFTITN